MTGGGGQPEKAERQQAPGRHLHCLVARSATHFGFADELGLQARTPARYSLVTAAMSASWYPAPAARFGFGLFTAPNTAAIMDAVPAPARGASSGMRATFQNTGTVVSIALYFSLLIAGLTASLPHTMEQALTANGVPAHVATRVADAPPVGSLFAAFLGDNPMRTALDPTVLGSLPPDRAAHLTGKRFFPGVVSGPFKGGLAIAFAASLAMCLVAAAACWLRGGRHAEDDAGATPRLLEAVGS
jgi:hypothetical protein